MFGRRRRPILGAAVVVGASRAAARHEVQKQTAVNAQREFEIEQEVGLRRREEEEQERRMQLAVNEATKKAVPENQAAQQSAAAVVPPPPQQYYNPQSPMPIQTTTVPAPLYTQFSSATPSIQPEQLMPAPYSEVPAYLSGSPLGEESPKIAQGIGSPGPAAGPKMQYCTHCGFACQVGDRFCRQCGAKQGYQEQMIV